MTELCVDTGHEAAFFVLSHDYILPVCSILAAASMLPPVFIYARDYYLEVLKTSQLNFYLGFTAFFLICACYIILTIRLPTAIECDHVEIYFPLTVTGFLLYFLQNLTLLAIFFNRLSEVFDATMHELRKRTKIIFLVCLVVLVSIALIGYFSMFARHGALEQGFNWHSSVIAFLFIGIAPILIAVLDIFLVLMFVYKLSNHVYQLQREETAPRMAKSMLTVMIKACVLCLVSSFNILLTMAIWLIAAPMGSVYFWFFYDIIFMVDMYTSFLCILLSFSRFRKEYDTICGCCHDRCSAFWTRRVERRRLAKGERVNSGTSANSLNAVDESIDMTV